MNLRSHCKLRLTCTALLALAFGHALIAADPTPAASPAAPPAANEKIVPEFSRGVGPGWFDLTGKDFLNVNCWDDTWVWKEGHAFCTGRPTGVIRYKEPLTNFEFSCEWMHKKKGGNSGIFVWASPESILSLTKGKGSLPHGIEVQVLDLGYKEIYEAQFKKPGNWFTSHGDVFPVGPVKMKPFPPVAPDGQRAFPSKETTLGINNWNHYYIRAIDGEVRLWVNGEQVSGGNGISPASGFLCLESEGAPVEFKNLRLRKLPPMETKLPRDMEIPVPVIVNPANRPAVKLDGHAILGTWEYQGTYTREFLADGQCILRDKTTVIWTRKCVEKTAATVTLEGGLEHKLEGDKLKIEGRYEATRRK
ncbi:DUF1080 domain-containing protein [Humisphaera borealis]|uniref:DUF1080 domain-containing protein n=1 Tax=Humisphaera borealis TaxID=2807512 RepID=A0A7M2X3V0_9BACT|nr:DUF1080 domain-containing protein [Humisphaera borealis]